jgi:hypothetical protein
MTGACNGRNSLHGSIGAQSAAGDGAPVVLPQPLPRHARAQALRGTNRCMTPKRAHWLRIRLSYRFLSQTSAERSRHAQTMGWPAMAFVARDFVK